MAGNNGGTLTGTFQRGLSMRSSGFRFGWLWFRRMCIRRCPSENSLENSESEDSVISIIIFYNIHGTAKIHISICRYFYSLQKCNNTKSSKMWVSLGKMLVNACVSISGDS